MSDTIRALLAPIRANDTLAHDLHGKGWDNHATDAEIDRSVLLAAVDAALEGIFECVRGAGIGAELGFVSEADEGLVLYVAEKVRERIAAALSQDTEAETALRLAEEAAE